MKANEDQNPATESHESLGPTQEQGLLPTAPQDAETPLTDAEVDAFIATCEDGPDDDETRWRVALRMFQKTHDDLVALRQQVEDTIAVARTDVDGDDSITAYHFKTGAIHRLLAEARKGDGPCSPDTEIVHAALLPATNIQTLARKIVEAVWKYVRRYDDGDIWMETLKAEAAVRQLLKHYARPKRAATYQRGGDATRNARE